VASVTRGWVCCVLDTAGSSWLPWTYHRTRLSPSAKMVVPQAKHTLQRAKQQTGRGEGNQAAGWAFGC